MKIEDLERYLALAKAHGCTDITFWDDDKTFDINQTNTTYPLDNIGSHVSMVRPHVYSIEIDRTDRDDDR
jgi:hypothetical protein